MDQLNAYFPIILVAAAIAALLIFLLLRPKQKVKLSDDLPRRPHMSGGDSVQPGTDRTIAAHKGEGHSIADEMAAATSDIAGDFLEAPVHANLPGASGPPDDLQKLKGVGPKLAQLLNGRGIIRFEQIARLTPDEVTRLEAGLGAFRGRFERDRIVEQADYLARGDVDGFEARFGRIEGR